MNSSRSCLVPLANKFLSDVLITSSPLLSPVFLNLTHFKSNLLLYPLRVLLNQLHLPLHELLSRHGVPIIRQHPQWHKKGSQNQTHLFRWRFSSEIPLTACH